jgi:integrase/recombinase XerD
MPDNAAVGFWVRRFLSDHLMHERGVSRNTQRSYRDTFCLFLPFVATRLKTAVDRLVIDDLSPGIVSDFLAYLEQTRSCSVATRNQRLATLHAFARFTGESSPEHVDWCAQIRNISFKRAWRKQVLYLEKDEIDELLRAPDRATEQGQRDYALLLLLYNSGARATEAARILIEDLTWDATGTGSVKIHGKGRKVRFCPLWKKTMGELRLLIRGRNASNPLFLNRYRDPITRFGIHTLVARHAVSAATKVPSLKTKRVSPHTIRHYSVCRTITG